MELETRDALCPVCGLFVAKVSFPVGTSEEIWGRALQGYAHAEHASSIVLPVSETEALRNDIEALKSDAANTVDDLANAKADLSAMRGDLENTKADLENAKTDLAQVRDNVAAVAADVTEIKTASPILQDPAQPVSATPANEVKSP